MFWTHLENAVKNYGCMTNIVGGVRFDAESLVALGEIIDSSLRKTHQYLSSKNEPVMENITLLMHIGVTATGAGPSPRLGGARKDVSLALLNGRSPDVLLAQHNTYGRVPGPGRS